MNLMVKHMLGGTVTGQMLLNSTKGRMLWWATIIPSPEDTQYVEKELVSFTGN